MIVFLLFLLVAYYTYDWEAQRPALQISSTLHSLFVEEMKISCRSSFDIHTRSIHFLFLSHFKCMCSINGYIIVFPISQF